MRALVVSIWVFINLVFFGMCGYMYLLWSQYWMYLDRQSSATTSTYDQQIYFYNRGYLPSESANRTHNATSKSRIKHSVKDNSTSSVVTLVKNSRPRFPSLQMQDFEFDSKTYQCRKNDSGQTCRNKARNFKEKILQEMQRVMDDESNILRMGMENPYNVRYTGPRSNFMTKSQRDVICELKRAKVRTLRKSDVDGTINNLGDFLPKRYLMENRRFNSCAIVASAGSLKNSNLGATIDSHDLVLRFNHAPTKGFERDVGKKTTIRVLNSQVMTRPEFRFLRSPIYRNVTIVAWDPSNYQATLDEWLEKPEFNLFPNYIEYRKRQKARIFLVNPQSLWELWNFLQANSPSRLRRNPLSSGFLGLSLLLPLCDFVDMFEYIPSSRVTKRCHYYDPEDNPACTFGVWHPLAAEKLLTYHLNEADDETVFHKGFARIAGFKKWHC